MNHLVDRELFGRNKIFFLIRRSWEREAVEEAVRTEKERERGKRRTDRESRMEQWKKREIVLHVQRVDGRETNRTLTVEMANVYRTWTMNAKSKRGRRGKRKREKRGRQTKRERRRSGKSGRCCRRPWMPGVLRTMEDSLTVYFSAGYPSSRPPVAAVRINRERIHREKLNKK